MDPSRISDAFMACRSGNPPQGDDGESLNMVEFLNSRNSPWAPVTRLIPEPSTARVTGLNAGASYSGSFPHTGAFLGYRNTGIGSDCETAPGDSGYGTCVPPSVETTSIYGDNSFQAIPEVEHGMRSFHFGLADSPTLGMSHTPGDLPAEPPSPKPSNKSQPLYCQDCCKVFRTKSRFNKHRLSHVKPFTCTYTHCDRRDTGFGSSNDLQRHISSVHKDYGSGTIYTCREDPCSRGELKLYSRSDNFRSHLKKKHNLNVGAKDDLSAYIYQQEPASPVANDLSGVGTKLQDSLTPPPGNPLNIFDKELPEFSEMDPCGLPAGFPAPGMEALQNNGASPTHPPPLSDFSWYLQQVSALFDTSGRGDLSGNMTNNGSGYYTGRDTGNKDDNGDTGPCLVSTDDVVEAMSPPRAPKPAVHEPSITNTDNEGSQAETIRGQSPLKQIPPIIRDMDAASDESVTLEWLRKLPRSLLKKAMDGASSSSISDEERPPATPRRVSSTRECHCGRVFARPCELRKHMKRHERPYGCTIAGCERSFGSKNDWKRHESSQHDLNELWCCEHNSHGDCGSSTDCAQNSFWCGFCHKLILAQQSSPSLNDQRFDHIDDHYMGRRNLRKQRIDVWSHPEMLTTSGTTTPLENTAGFKRKACDEGGTRSVKRSRA